MRTSHALSDRRLAVAGLMGLLALLWTVVEGLPAFASQEYSLYQVVWMRYAAHLLCMLIVLAPRHGWNLVRTRRPALQIGRGLLMLAMPVCFITALGQMRLPNLLAIFWLSPLLVLAFAAWLHRERAGAALWLATAAGCVGAQLVLRPSAGFPWSGVLLALGMGLSFALYIVLTRTLRHERTEANLFYTAASVLLPLSIAMPLVWSTPTLHDLVLMAGVGTAGLALLWALDRACELAPVSLLAPFLTMQLVVSVLLTFLESGALPGRRTLAGVALILGSALIGWYAGGRPVSIGGSIPPLEQQVTA